MNSATDNRDIEWLLHISHVLGANPRLVQAGGGNTSVKSADGKRMYIKASGTPLSHMTPKAGWVCVDIATITALFSRADLQELSPRERESEVLGVLNGSIIEPAGNRPSVETPLHALLDRVIMHSHAVAANALSCHREGERVFMAMFDQTTERPPLWVPTIDPGATLAFAVTAMIDEYQRKHATTPDVMILQNHGLFVCAPTPWECVLKQHAVLERIESWFAGQRKRPEAFSAMEHLIGAAFAACIEDTQKPDTIRFSTDPRLNAAGGQPDSPLFSGALSPDHVVYTGPCACLLKPSATTDRIVETITAFHSRFNQLPRLFCVEGVGLCIATMGEKKWTAAEILARSVLDIHEAGDGNLRFLDKAGVDFILNWEAEHYRAKQT